MSCLANRGSSHFPRCSRGKYTMFTGLCFWQEGRKQIFDFSRTQVFSCLSIELENAQNKFCHPETAELRKTLLFLNKIITLSPFIGIIVLNYVLYFAWAYSYIMAIDGLFLIYSWYHTRLRKQIRYFIIEVIFIRRRKKKMVQMKRRQKICFLDVRSIWKRQRYQLFNCSLKHVKQGRAGYCEVEGSFLRFSVDFSLKWFHKIHRTYLLLLKNVTAQSGGLIQKQ